MIRNTFHLLFLASLLLGVLQPTAAMDPAPLALETDQEEEVVQAGIFASITNFIQSFSPIGTEEQLVEEAQEVAIEDCCICIGALADNDLEMDCCQQQVHKKCVETYAKKSLISSNLTRCPLCRKVFSEELEEKLDLAVTPAFILRDMGSDLTNHLTKERFEKKAETITFIENLLRRKKLNPKIQALFSEAIELLDSLSPEKLQSEQIVTDEGLQRFVSLLRAFVVEYNITDELVDEVCNQLDQTEIGQCFLYYCKDFVDKAKRLISLLNEEQIEGPPQEQEEFAQEIVQHTSLEVVRLLSHLSIFLFFSAGKIHDTAELWCINMTFAVFVALRKTYDSKDFLTHLAELSPSTLKSHIVLFGRTVTKGWFDLSTFDMHLLSDELRNSAPSPHQHNNHHPQMSSHRPIASIIPGIVFFSLVFYLVYKIPRWLAYRSGKKMFNEIEQALKKGNTMFMSSNILKALSRYNITYYGNSWHFEYRSDSILYALNQIKSLKEGFTHTPLEDLFTKYNTPDPLRTEVSSFHSWIVKDLSAIEAHLRSKIGLFWLIDYLTKKESAPTSSEESQ